MKPQVKYAIIIFVASLVLAVIASKVAIFMLPYILGIGSIGLVTMMLLEIKETSIPTHRFKSSNIVVRAMGDAAFPTRKDFETFFLNELGRFTDAHIQLKLNVLSRYRITYLPYRIFGIWEGVHQPVHSLCSPWSKEITVGLSSLSDEPLHTGVLGHEVRLCLVYETMLEQGIKVVLEKDLMRLMNKWGVYDNGPTYGPFKIN